MSINVEFNIKERNNIVIINTLKMLERRKCIKSWEEKYKKIDTSQLIIELKEDDTKYSLNIVNSKIQSIVKNSPLDTYLSSNPEVHKIIITENMTKKVIQQVISDYKNAEIFFESELLEDMPSKVFIPQHILLNKEEKTELLNKFNENELAKIHITDMQSRYYGAKVGDIFKIIRPSITAGMNIFYRKVVNSNWDILFA